MPSYHFEFFVLASPKNFVLFLEKKSLSTAVKSFFFFFSESHVFFMEEKGGFDLYDLPPSLDGFILRRTLFFSCPRSIPCGWDRRVLRNLYHLREEGSFGGHARLVSWTGSKTSLVPIRFLKLLYTETPFDTVDNFFSKTF